jgi:hypothetical protein
VKYINMAVLTMPCCTLHILLPSCTHEYPVMHTEICGRKLSVFMHGPYVKIKTNINKIRINSMTVNKKAIIHNITVLLEK